MTGDYRSRIMPADVALAERQPSKTRPVPPVLFSLAQKPSAFAPLHWVSLFWYESQLITEL